MAGFFQNLIRKLSPPKEPETPAVHVGAFGKHPGWNDHLDDLGLDTARLATLKTQFYVQGIGGNIDSRAWERLDEPQRLDGYHHLFVLEDGKDTVVGRFWSSSDGKGRKLYPMVVCAQFTHVPLAWALGEALPRLADLEARCTATTSADVVRDAVAGARSALVSHVAGAAPFAPAPPPARDAVAVLAACPEMGPEHRGLLTTIYHVEREMPSLLTGRYGPKEVPRPGHVRIPPCGATTEQSLLLWIGFLRRLVDPAVPVLALVPLDQPWIDLVAGPMTPAALYCILASRKSIPLATDIPYNLDEPFLTRARAMIAASTAAPAAPPPAAAPTAW